MPMSPTELARCTQAAARILEEMGLSAYQFAIEPRDETWDLLLECSAIDGWRTQSIPIDHAELSAALDDGETHDRVLARWREELHGCRTEARETRVPSGSEQPSA